MNQLVSIFDFCIAFNDSFDLLCFYAVLLFNSIVQFELGSLDFRFEIHICLFCFLFTVFLYFWSDWMSRKNIGTQMVGSARENKSHAVASQKQYIAFIQENCFVPTHLLAATVLWISKIVRFVFRSCWFWSLRCVHSYICRSIHCCAQTMHVTKARKPKKLDAEEGAQP